MAARGYVRVALLCTMSMVMVAMIMSGSAAACKTCETAPSTPATGGIVGSTPSTGGGVGSTPATGGTTTCSVNLLELSVCSPLLSAGSTSATTSSCCALLGILGVDLEVCLCLAVDVNVLGLVSVDIPKLDVVASILTTCGYTVPPNLACPN